MSPDDDLLEVAHATGVFGRHTLGAYDAPTVYIRPVAEPEPPSEPERPSRVVAVVLLLALAVVVGVVVWTAHLLTTPFAAPPDDRPAAVSPVPLGPDTRARLAQSLLRVAPMPPRQVELTAVPVPAHVKAALRRVR